MNPFSVKQILKKTELHGDIPTNSQAFMTTFNMAWPSIVESVLVHLVGTIDTMMVGTISPIAISAVGLTTQPKFIFLCIFMSLNVAVSALVARRKGEGRQDSANRVLKQAIMFTFILSFIATIVSYFCAGPIIRLAGSESDTHDLAVSYFRIIMGFNIFNVLSLVINAAQRGAGNTRIAMVTNLTSNGINLVFNYLLIGGKFGFPALGVKGAAIATVIGTVAQVSLSIYSVCHKDGFLYIGRFGKGGFDRETIRAIGNIGSSTLAEQLFLRIGFFTFTSLVARLGTNYFATHQIGMNILSISFSFGDGLSIAAVSLIGQNLGQKRPDLAKLYASLCQRCGLVFSSLLSVTFIFFGRNIYALFTEDPFIIEYGSKIMFLIMFIVFLQISQVIFSGSLRGAGDAKYTAMVSLISVTFLRPFFGWLLCYPIGLGLVGAWLGLGVDQLARFSLTYLRFRSGRWMNIKI